VRTCSIEGCDLPHFGKGLCNRHYTRMRKGCTDMRPGKISQTWKPDDPRYKNKGRTCDVEGCDKPFYAKGLCRNHYAYLRRTGRLHPLPKQTIQCRVDGCLESASRKGFCDFHYERFRRGVPLNKPFGNSGECNVHWKGGIFEYPKHYVMKKIRLEVLEEANYICEYCGGPADRIHHKDHSKDNHTKENLAACCHRCNVGMRKGKNISFIRLYGMAAVKMRAALGLSKNEIYRLHHQGQLRPYISALQERKQINAISTKAL
jgi:5-methylcytosine-specific restriction endonuclease McrA